MPAIQPYTKKELQPRNRNRMAVKTRNSSMLKIAKQSKTTFLYQKHTGLRSNQKRHNGWQNAMIRNVTSQ